MQISGLSLKSDYRTSFDFIGSVGRIRTNDLASPQILAVNHRHRHHARSKSPKRRIGLFKEVTLNRGMPMAPANETSWPPCWR
jgi:hypothetical protein